MMMSKMRSGMRAMTTRTSRVSQTVGMENTLTKLPIRCDCEDTNSGLCKMKVKLVMGREILVCAK